MQHSRRAWMVSARNDDAPTMDFCTKPANHVDIFSTAAARQWVVRADRKKIILD
jgi:hypothetical protein